MLSGLTHNKIGKRIPYDVVENQAVSLTKICEGVNEAGQALLIACKSLKRCSKLDMGPIIEKAKQSNSLRVKDSIGMTALHWVAQKGRDDVFNQLLAAYSHPLSSDEKTEIEEWVKKSQEASGWMFHPDRETIFESYNNILVRLHQQDDTYEINRTMARLSIGSSKNREKHSDKEIPTQKHINRGMSSYKSSQSGLNQMDEENGYLSDDCYYRIW